MPSTTVPGAAPSRPAPVSRSVLVLAGLATIALLAATGSAAVWTTGRVLDAASVGPSGTPRPLAGQESMAPADDGGAGSPAGQPGAPTASRSASTRASASSSSRPGVATSARPSKPSASSRRAPVAPTSVSTVRAGAAGLFGDFPASGNAYQMAGGVFGNDPDSNHFRVTRAQGLVITASNYGYTTGSTHNGLGIGVKFPAQPGQDSENWFTVEMRAANGAALQVGRVYPNATRAAFADAGPGVDISGNGSGNNTLTGSFEITRLEYNSDGSPRNVEGWAQLFGDSSQRSPCKAQFRVVNQAPSATPS